MNQPKLLICTATHSESKPIIQGLGLKRQHQEKAFCIYKSDNGDITLIESGIGAINAACAISYIVATAGDIHSACCINIGIAGGNRPIGSLFEINKITDITTKKRYYPSTISTSFNETSLLTHATPCNNYPQNEIVDMEACGFYIAASRFICNEQIGILKVVSDNDDNSRLALNPNSVSALMSRHSDSILNYIHYWRDYSTQLSTRNTVPAVFQDLICQANFSTYQTNELKHLLIQFNAINDISQIESDLKDMTCSKLILRYLKSAINESPVNWSSDAKNLR